MKEIELKVHGMSCQHCVMAVKMELKNLQLESSDVNIGSVKVSFDEGKTSREDIIAAIEEAGYKVVEN